MLLLVTRAYLIAPNFASYGFKIRWTFCPPLCFLSTTNWCCRLDWRERKVCWSPEQPLIGRIHLFPSDCKEQAFAEFTQGNGRLLAEWSGSSLAALGQVVGLQKCLLLSLSTQLVGFPFPYEGNLAEQEEAHYRYSTTTDILLWDGQ